MREQIGSYRIERVIAEGAIGVVYKGCHTVIGRHAAIKTVLPRHASDPQMCKRLLAEAKAQARLNHPHVVTLYEPIDDHGELFIAMEYVDGETLAERLERIPGRRMPLGDALSLFEQLLDALGYVHGEQIVHRDVKPSNVMIGRNGQLKLTDFGLALLAGEPRLTASLRVAGTPQYMSPEQLQGKHLDHRSDIYSAALVLYRMLSGRAAFESREYLGQVHERMTGPPALQELVPGLSASVCATVAAAMHVEPEQRFPSALAFREELRRARAGFFPLPTTVIQNEQPEDRAEEEPFVAPPEFEAPHLSNFMAWSIIAGCVMAAPAMLVLRRDAPEPAVVTAGSIPPKQPEKTDAPPVADPTTREGATPQRPPQTRPKNEPGLEPHPAKTPAADDDGELDALRQEIRSGKSDAADLFAMKRFADAIEELDRVDRIAQRAPAELWAERDEIAHLRSRVVGAQTEAQFVQQQAEFWRSRLTDIENRIDEGRFPEAIGIAEKLENDPKTPPDVAASAAALLQQAKAGLVDSFSGTTIGATTTSIQKKQQ